MTKIIITLFFLIMALVLFFPSASQHSITNATPQGQNIIAFGDSLTYGTGAKPGMDYPSQLSAMLQMPIMNKGIPGDTSAMALKRIDDVLNNDPRIVILTLGGNDILKKVPKDVAFKNLETMVRKIQQQGALVIIGGIDIPLFGKGFGNAYKALAIKTGAVLVPNIYQGIRNHTNLMSDPIHPNAQGYQKMAEHFYKAMQPYLSQKTSKRPLLPDKTPNFHLVAMARF